MRVVIDERVMALHPEVGELDVIHAVTFALRHQTRLGTEPVRYVGIGPGLDGRVLQWIAVRMQGADDWYVFHAMPVTDKVLVELDMKKGGRRG